jgi:hypothetical protein
LLAEEHPFIVLQEGIGIKVAMVRKEGIQTSLERNSWLTVWANCVGFSQLYFCNNNECPNNLLVKDIKGIKYYE